MTAPHPTEDDRIEAARARLLDAALPHVLFDGWSDAALQAAAADAGIDPSLARAAAPRGGIDLAVAFHRRGDATMRARLAQEDLGALRIRDRVTLAVRTRLEDMVPHRDAVRRASALFALPQNMSEGAQLIWGTADAIWEALDDPSRDFAWYSKRASLSAVYGAVVLYWLGDDSEGASATWAFLDRRIDNVMSFEATKARVRATPVGRAFAAGPGRILDALSAPKTPGGLPGRRPERAQQ